MFEAAVPARPLIPMAISLGYGVLYASIMTLFLVPCGYVILDDLRKLLRGRKRIDVESRDPEATVQDDAEVVPISGGLDVAAS